MNKYPKSPIIEYNDGAIGGGIFACTPGSKFNLTKFAFTLVIIYIIYMLYSQFNYEYFNDRDGGIYNEPWITNYPEQSLYAGTNGFGLNYES